MKTYTLKDIQKAVQYVLVRQCFKNTKEATKFALFCLDITKAVKEGKQIKYLEQAPEVKE